MLGVDVDWLGVSRRVTEGLHGQVGRETEAGQIFQLVAGHRAGGVLRTNGGHFGFAVSAGANTSTFGQTAGATNHFLRQGVAFASVGGLLGQTEQSRSGQTQ